MSMFFKDIKEDFIYVGKDYLYPNDIKFFKFKSIQSIDPNQYLANCYVVHLIKINNKYDVYFATHRDQFYSLNTTTYLKPASKEDMKLYDSVIENQIFS